MSFTINGLSAGTYALNSLGYAENQTLATSLKTMGSLIGLDANTFGTCVDNGQHNSEIQTAQSSVPNDAQGTPAIYIAGKLVAQFDLATISAAIDAALNPASPSPSAAATPSASVAPTATVAPTASPS